MDRETLETYRQMLPINKHRLDEELEVQAEVLDRIGQQLTKAERRVAQLKERAALTEGRLIENYKFEAPKITVKEIEAKLSRDRERIAAWEAHQDAIEDHSAWSRLWTAWSARGKDIKVLADLYSTQYWTRDSLYERRQDRPSYDSLRERIAAHREETGNKERVRLR